MPASTLDRLEIGSVPAEESAAQVGKTADARSFNRIECQFYALALATVYGEPPDGASFGRSTSHHDFGSYNELTVRYRTDDATAAAYAFQVEQGLANWSAAGFVAPVLYDERSQGFIHPAFAERHITRCIHADTAGDHAGTCPCCDRPLTTSVECQSPCLLAPGQHHTIATLLRYPRLIAAASAHAPAGPYWVIRSSDGLYWSNELGWTESPSADVYLDAEKATVTPPLDGDWVTIR